MNIIRRATALLAAAVLIAGTGALVTAAPASADVTGLNQPVRARVLPDGRVLAIEKAGVLKLAPTTSSTASTILDIRSKVASYEDHGLTGLAYRDGYVYLGYTARPPAGQVGSNNDCPNFRLESGGCPTTAYLSRFSLSSTGQVGPEQRLFGGIPQICILYTTHGLDDLEFGPDGRLYFSVGDGAGFTGTDVGQGPNAGFCGASEGEQKGALRAQTDYNLNGKVLSALPDGTGLRTEAKGLRNPFSIAFDGAGALWIGDTGWSSFEEINKMTTGGAVENFGWPCFEGPAGSQPADLAGYNQQPVCQQLKAAGTVVAPVKAYGHPETAGATNKFASISALAPHAGRIYFGDYSLTQVASMLPDGSDTRTHATSRFPVDLTPVGNALWMVDIGTGTFAPAPIGGVVEAPVGDPVAEISSTGAVTPGTFLKLSVQSNLIPERDTNFGITWTAKHCKAAGGCVERYFTNRTTQQTETEVPKDFAAGDTLVVTVRVDRAGVTATDSITLTGATTTPPPTTTPTTPPPTTSPATGGAGAAGSVSGPVEAFDLARRTFRTGGLTYAYDDGDFLELADRGEWIGKWEKQLCVGCLVKGTYVPGGRSELDLTPAPTTGGGTTPPPPPPATAGTITGTVQSFSLPNRTITVGGKVYAYDDSDFFRVNGTGEWIVKWEQRLVVGRTVSITPYAPGGTSSWNLTVP